MSVAGTTLANRAKLLKARTLLAERDPFLGHLVLNLPVQVTVEPSITTACVTAFGQCLIRDSFLAQLHSTELATILLHETLHLALDWHQRRGTRNPALWNYAHDLAINGLIQDSLEYGHPMRWPASFPGLLETSLHGMAAEPIYDLLLESLCQEAGQPGFPAFDLLQVLAPAKPGAADRWSEEQRAAALRVLRNYETWVLDLSTEAWEQLDPSVREQLRLRWQEALLVAAEQGLRDRGPGSLPKWAELLLGPLLTPKVPWWVVLARRVHGHLQGERRSFSRPGRRGRAAGVSHPWFRCESWKSHRLVQAIPAMPPWPGPSAGSESRG